MDDNHRKKKALDQKDHWGGKTLNMKKNIQWTLSFLKKTHKNCDVLNWALQWTEFVAIFVTKPWYIRLITTIYLVIEHIWFTVMMVKNQTLVYTKNYL